MMERLTERFSNGQAAVYGCGNNCKYDYKYCNNHYEDCPTINNIYEKLAKYEDAEEQGLLLRLPCKVGDTVYEISRVEPYRNPAIREMGIVDILIRDNDIYITLQDLYDEYYDNSILSTEFGKTVFLTQAEAEQKLNEMERC